MISNTGRDLQLDTTPGRHTGCVKRFAPGEVAGVRGTNLFRRTACHKLLLGETGHAHRSDLPGAAPLTASEVLSAGRFRLVTELHVPRPQGRAPIGAPPI